MDFYSWIRAQWDRAAALVALVIGVIALIIGWVGVSGVTLPTEQIPYIVSGGLVGMFALGIAGTLWLSADLRDEWRKLDAIHQELLARGVAPTEAGAPGLLDDQTQTIPVAQATQAVRRAPARPAGS